MDLISRAEYVRYHQLLAIGVRDERLLNEMIWKALEIGNQIVRNSQLRLYPDHGFDCDCGHTARFVDDQPEQHDCGYWKCQCGQIYDWEAEVGEMYSDQYEKVGYLVFRMEEADSIEEKAAYFEALLQVVHGSGPMARWFIEGGTRTLSEFSDETLIMIAKIQDIDRCKLACA